MSRACVGFVDGVRPSVGPDRVAVRRVVGAREPRQREERGEETDCPVASLQIGRDAGGGQIQLISGIKKTGFLEARTVS